MVDYGVTALFYAQISSVRKKENLEVRQMRRVVIDMQNALFADAVAEALRRFDPEKVVME